MLPRWHILSGILFSLLLFFFIPGISFLYILLIFISSFLIDFDHYAVSVIKTKKFSLYHSFQYHKQMRKKELAEIKKGIKRKGDFHLFHTIEFHIIIGLLSLVWSGFFYIFIGMVFHSLLDIISLIYDGTFYRREYFLFNWLKKS